MLILTNRTHLWGQKNKVLATSVLETHFIGRDGTSSFVKCCKLNVMKLVVSRDVEFRG